VASYRLLIKRSAAKELEALPRKDRNRIIAKMQDLAGNPGFWVVGGAIRGSALT
jgi:mRNA-degrading endonuclease RelE of RelBE toxin-antitoxin system